MAAKNPVRRLITVVWGDWQTNALWQRILKYTIACVAAVIIAILPHFKTTSSFLAPMVTVFAHPAQRMGRMIEALLMILFGSLLGLAWSMLGLYLSSLVELSNPPAAYTIRALFLLVCVLLHGFVRSHSPRLFNFVLFLLVAALLTIQLPSHSTTALITNIYIPILLGGGVLLLVNIAVFPELSSSYLGSSTIEALSKTADTLERTTFWFTTPGGDRTAPKSSADALAETIAGLSSGAGSNQTKHFFIRSLRRVWARLPSPFHTDKASAGFLVAPMHLTKLANLTKQKSKLRAELGRCKAAQDEVNYELFLSALAPDNIRPISVRYMAGLVQNIITMIGACENKFVLVENYNVDEVADVHQAPSDCQPTEVTHNQQRGVAQGTAPRNLRRDTAQVHQNDKVGSVKPVREIEAGSAEVLESTIHHIKRPIIGFQESMKDAVAFLVSCLAYCFDVRTLPSGASAPSGIRLEEIDLRIDLFSGALAEFDAQTMVQLKHATMAATSQGVSVDFMPRMETFLASSFLLAFRDCGVQILQMLRHARTLVEMRTNSGSRLRIWLPQKGNIRKWLTTGGEADGMVLSENTRQATRQGNESISAEDNANDSSEQLGEKESPNGCNSKKSHPENPVTQKAAAHAGVPRKTSPMIAKLRQGAADAIEWLQSSDEVDYSLKLAIAVFLVTWPAFVHSWSAWYIQVKGVWAPMQLILVFEMAIGTSLFVFAVRLFGVVFGCVVGYLSVEIGRGNHVAAVVILLFGIVPSVYVQIATQYVKAGMISIVSMAVVALAAVNSTTPAYEIFYKRFVAFLVGGLVAVVVETVITPVRARDRLVTSLSCAVRQLQKMHAAVAVGIDDPERADFRSPKLFSRFSHSRDKAQAALAAAETFLPFCLSEPRLKGSFKPMAPIYKEIIYVLHQITDRMDTVVQLRRAHGSSVLEDLNPKVHIHRRNVAAGCTLILFSVNEALTTWLPLPQFLPSARLAQLRLINRVREILTAQNGTRSRHGSVMTIPKLDEETASVITQRKFLSWNASTAGQVEIIEYLEELVELVKLLVGVNAFRSGVLEKAQYRQYERHLAAERTGDNDDDENGEPSAMDGQDDSRALPAGGRRQDDEEAQTTSDQTEDDGIPLSLQRVGTRLRQDERLVRRRGYTIV